MFSPCCRYACFLMEIFDRNYPRILLIALLLKLLVKRVMELELLPLFLAFQILSQNMSRLWELHG